MVYFRGDLDGVKVASCPAFVNCHIRDLDLLNVVFVYNIRHRDHCHSVHLIRVDFRKITDMTVWDTCTDCSVLIEGQQSASLSYGQLKRFYVKKLVNKPGY